MPRPHRPTPALRKGKSVNDTERVSRAEAHLRLGMLFSGTLRRPIDWLDLVWHSWPFVLAGIKGAAKSDPSRFLTSDDDGQLARRR